MKRLFAVSTTLVFLAFLSACNSVTTTPAVSLSVSPKSVTMDSVTTSNVEITAEGAWELTSDASWLSADPPEGTGSATVALHVDPADLSPGRYDANLDLLAADGTDTTTVTFRFPRISGTVIKEDATTSSVGPQSTAPLPATPGRLIVGLEQEAASASPTAPEHFDELAREIASLYPGLSLHDSHPNAGVAVYEAIDRRAAAASLVVNIHVRYVEVDHEVDVLATNDTHRSLQWGLDTIAADDAWATSTGSGVRVAIIDTGFHPDHPDLAGNVTYQYDFGDVRSSVTSTNANCGTHGSHVAGIVGAVTNNDEGIAAVARDASLLLLDVNDSSQDNCPIYVSNLIAALDWVAGGSGGPNADTVNISLGTGSDPQGLHDAIKAAYSAGATIVAAAGNDPQAAVLYPAAYPQVIAVSATAPSDEIASYSTTGPEIWVSAPGGDKNGSGIVEDSILSTVYDYSQASFRYSYMDGTSMASPAVAGIAALIKGVNPDLAPRDVADVLAQSSVDLGPAGRDDDYGYGRVDAWQAVELATTTTPSKPAYVVKTSDGRSIDVPEDGSFNLGYVSPGELTLEAGSDDNENGVLDDSGEYYGRITLQVDFDGPQPAVELVVEKQP